MRQKDYNGILHSEDEAASFIRPNEMSFPPSPCNEQKPQRASKMVWLEAETGVGREEDKSKAYAVMSKENAVGNIFVHSNCLKLTEVAFKLN